MLFRSRDELAGLQAALVAAERMVAEMAARPDLCTAGGILHGGASVALAESLGSLASVLCIEDPSTHTPVGVEINANHLRPVPDGRFVIGTLSPIRIGRRIHVWNIEIRDPDDKLVCISRLTIMIVERG